MDSTEDAVRAQGADLPVDLLRFVDGPGAVVEVFVNAPPEAVWRLVTDVDVPARFSGEFLGATWEGDTRGVGAVFHGRNRNEFLGEWTIPCFVDAWDEPRAFGWRTSDPDNPGARWRFELTANGTGTRLRFLLGVGPGPSGLTAAIAQHPDKEDRVLRRRIRDLTENMQATVDGIKRLTEEGL
ncbi:MAG TPA: SRPBCC domain-containing protein [Mycobacteriales bacterium]